MEEVRCSGEGDLTCIIELFYCKGSDESKDESCTDIINSLYKEAKLFNANIFILV